MKSKMLGALALFTLIGALFILQSAGTGPPTVDAATGTIDALNVGTCLTTDAALFEDEDCDLADDDADEPWEVREEIGEVTTLYATYAHDPKTASDEPRAILMNSDLIQISISDPDRDKRTGVLVRGASYSGVNDPTDSDDTAAVFDEDQSGSLAAIIRADLDADDLSYQTAADDDPSDAEEDITFTSEEAGDRTDGIWLYQGHTGVHPNQTPNETSEIPFNGGYQLNITRAGDIGTNDGSNPWQFKPADFDVANGAIVRFYGCQEDTGGDGDCADPGETIKKLTELTVDEDASNGEASGNTAPWLAVNASIPSDKQVVIMAVYYRTSNEENLVGEETYRECAGSATLSQTNNAWSCSDASAVIENDGEFDVNFSSNEKANNTALKVEASSANDARPVNLHLTETGRFDGVYQGFLRLTDADGDGRVHSTSGSDRDNWGLEIKDAGDGTMSNAAVLGVESGPVTITYRDTDGNTQTLRIEIDNRAPSIDITSPANGSSSNDRSPDFVGSFEDPDSGLVDKSFRLVVDNDVDGNDGKNSDFALSQTPIGAPNANEVDGSGIDGMGKVTHIGEYTGYANDTDMTVGVTSASALYALGDDSCEDATCYIEAEEHDDGAIRGTFDDSVRLNLQDASGNADTRDREFEIDFQAFVLDMAGNIGFSDSDRANPRFINAWGEDEADDRDPNGRKHNVLGYYSAHIIKLDDKDPEINEDATATGYYGLNADDQAIPDRTGIMVAFDGPLASDTVSTSTFTVELDDGTAGQIVDVDVAKDYVFLKLASELASDATPEVGITVGETVEDLAGNDKVGRVAEAFEANDGITPRLTVTLSGGSGIGTGDEGPEKLTKDKMTVHVSSDEALQGSPRIIVVCSSLAWNTGGEPDSDSTTVKENASGVVSHDIDDFVANLNGSFSGKPLDLIEPNMTSPRTGTAPAYEFTCGYDANDDDFEDTYSLMGLDVSSLSRPGENWDHTWQNRSGSQELANGLITAVAFARDRSGYSMQNWGSASAEFTFDDKLVSPAEPDGIGGDLQPEDGGVSKESRPFILIDFTEGSTVTLDSVELDNVEIADQFTMPSMNRFVYWPDTLSQGDHEVEVQASDAAGNEVAFDYEFEVVERGDFVIELQAGWNAISVPASPIDTAIGSVFTDAAITTVIGWDTQGWRIAVRRDGVWESNQQYGALNDVQSKYGYWVKSDKFVNQPVALQGPIGRDAGSPGTPIGIDTLPGWNFVGVIDQDGDQTEGHFGIGLKSGDVPVKAGEYLGSNYVRAYTWDPTFSRFENLAKDDSIEIGAGVWVYYEGGIAP